MKKNFIQANWPQPGFSNLLLYQQVYLFLKLNILLETNNGFYYSFIVLLEESIELGIS